MLRPASHSWWQFRPYWGPPRFEVRAAFFLPAKQFNSYDWRFNDQRELLKQLLLDAAPIEAD